MYYILYEGLQMYSNEPVYCIYNNIIYFILYYNYIYICKYIIK